MNKRTPLGILAAGGLAVIISCDGGTSAGLGANDCPYGTFRPAGLADCVFAAMDVNNQLFGVSDNRCAFGQLAVPPQCYSDAGDRAYLSTSSKCATGYRFLPGSCNRNEGNSTGFGTGTAGASTGFGAGAAGDASTGAAGAIIGEAGSGGAGGSGVAGMAGGIGGASGGIGGTSGASGTGGSANAGGLDASDGSAE